MKKSPSIFWILIAGLAILFSSCSRQEPVVAYYSPLQMSGILWGTQAGLAHPRTLIPEDEGYSGYLASYYGVDASLLQDGAVCYTGETDASEIAVLEVSDSNDVPLVETALLQYIEDRTGDFFGYMPDQVRILEGSLVATNGNYVALLICEDTQLARQTFALCFQKESSLVDPFSLETVPRDGDALLAGQEEEDRYEPDAVLAAWRTGETGTLSEKNLRILETATAVIGEVVIESMTEYEKELAVHDWIIQWAAYDEETVNHAPDAQPDPDNDNPYGILIGRRGICSGYSTTFQLFMDLLNIECITVNGWALEERNEHAWNMVRLDGEWYCVDVTWNDPVGLEEYDPVIQHMFFNITSQEMRDSEHEWEKDGVPEAVGTLYRWEGDAP